ncbi:MAG TPA: 50S ribosomal protein L15e [Candidatus Bathyarchaeia archaeon]|nr:50S ribosomal protein L15e [Candidatus Bathyarchaeia archaeon]
MKSMYAYVRDAWRDPERSYVKSLAWQRLQTWRREPAVTRIARPTRLDRARALGYKAKQGIIIARVKTWRGGRRKQRARGGRRTKHLGKNKLTARKSSQRIAEERAARRFPNLEVLNSYWVGQDGKSKWYEIILVDPSHPCILSDRNLNWITDSRGRAYRGKTSAGRKGRGLRRKGRGAEKTLPS